MYVVVYISDLHKHTQKIQNPYNSKTNIITIINKDKYKNTYRVINNEHYRYLKKKEKYKIRKQLYSM